MADRPPLCPICKKLMQPKFRPFCSARCADVDLGRWFTESYAVSGSPRETVDGPADADDEDAAG